MTPVQKQTELERYRAILLATLDYLQQHFGGNFVSDQYDLATEYYEQQKIQTEKYFKQRRLDRMQQRFASLTKRLLSRTHLDFATYIKEKTGYDIDIVEDLRKRVDAIIAQNEINSQSELNDIDRMLHLYYETVADGKTVEKLKALVNEYQKHTNAISGKKKKEYSKVVSRVEKDGMVEVTVRSWTGSKPKHYVEQWATSPDEKRKLCVVQWSNGKQASTYINIHFPTSNGPVYGIDGVHTDIKAWWKNNSTIVIETNKEYKVNTQSKQMISFDDVISIEYIEH